MNLCEISFHGRSARDAIADATGVGGGGGGIAADALDVVVAVGEGVVGAAFTGTACGLGIVGFGGP